MTHAVVLSAASREQLERAAGRLRAHLSAVLRRGAAPPVADIAFTTQTGRVAMAYRLMVTCDDVPELLSGLDGFTAGVPGPGVREAVVHVPTDEGPEPAGELDAAAAWLGGRVVAWERYWPTHRARVALPTYPFASEATTSERSSEAAATPVDTDAEAAEEYVTGLYSEASGIPAAKLHARVPLEDYGLSSALVAHLNARLERDLGPVAHTLFFEHRDLAGVARALAAHPGPWRAAPPPAPRAAPTEPQPAGRGRAPAPTRERDVAIVGIAGRYPRAPDLERFWEILVQGRDCIEALPAERRRAGWPVELMWGGFLDGVDRFDPLFFNISPRDADRMDPQERLFLEVVWETLEDAGYSRQRLRDRHRSRVGVFAGSMYNDYPFFGVERTLGGEPVDTGSSLAGIANRVSYFLDLSGPSLAVDTMCSSSLTCIHLAVQSLLLGECEAAIAGGVNLSLHPNKFIQQARLGMTSSDHRCRSFADGGDGFAPGEGVGAVMLKPLDRARADGDRIHAVITGTAVNHGGRTNGYMVPNPVAQGELVHAALERAGVSAAAIGYLEAHGTGTELGDPIEINGLLRAFAGAGAAPASCAIGSVKSNIGHLEAAAGIAGVTKVVLQLRHRRLVPSLHADPPNPRIDWEHGPFRVQREVADWPAPADGPRRAGVSSFGAGGANAHVVVEAYEPEAPARPSGAGGGRPRLVVLSARGRDGLREMAGRLASCLRRPTGPELEDVAYTLQVGREPLRERLALVARELPELCERLERFRDGLADGVLQGRAAGPGQAPARPLPEAGFGGTDAELRALGEHWVAGGPVDWDRLLGPEAAGRPRLVGLPSYPFERRRCWLPEPEPGQTAGREVPLYEKAWLPDPDPATGWPIEDGPVLCLCNDGTEAAAAELGRRLGPDRVVLLREGDERAPGSPFPRQPPAAVWVDLRDLGAEAAGAWKARLVLLRQVLGRPARSGLRVLHVTRGLQGPAGPPPSLAGARMAAFVRSLGAEHRRAAATTMDTDIAPDRAADLAEQVLGELRVADAYGEACYRGGRRHRPGLHPVAGGHAPLVLDPSAAYVVTGGTRGLGALVARHLVRRGARRLALLALHPLPPRAEWEALAGGEAISREVEAVRTVRALEVAGARVLVHTGPLTRRDDLAGFLADVRSRLGDIGGLVHCAGLFSRGGPALAHKDAEDIRAVLEPKVDGLETLAELTAGDRPAFFVLFSSVSATVRPLAAGVADYAAANAFMDLFAGHQARSGRACFHSVGWPVWGTNGRDSSNPGLPLGLAAIGDDEGLRVLERVVALPSGGAVVACPPVSGEVDLERLLRVDPTVPAVAEPRAGAPAAEAPAVPAWLTELFSRLLGIPEAELDPEAELGELGVESVMLVELLRGIEKRLGRPLEPTTLLDHPTLRGLAAHLRLSPAAAGPAPRATLPAPGPPPAAAGQAGDRVAVIGMACRFPGAPDVATFWANLAAGRCAVREVPASRWDHRRLYRPTAEPGMSISRWGGFLEGIEDFDPDHFGLTDEEATGLDPTIRLFLEAAATCLSDAGYHPAEVHGRDVGVFAGARITGYGRRVGPRAGGLHSDQNFIAAQVAQQFDLRGPNLVVDSACSSSLVSLQLACRSLLARESELALAGGVEVLLDEQPYLEFSAAGALSPSGRCRTFDERADGFVPGEGCGVLLLKRLDEALADGDRVRAVIESVAVNNDGRTMGMTTPNPAAQAAVVRRALAAAGRRPLEVGMVEAHGTATMIGDPIELRALTDVFGEGAERTGWCAIGSVKSNLGHLFSAAGVAGVMKAILALEHSEIPPTLFCDTPNPRFDFAGSPFYPNTAPRTWPASGGQRVAGVSAFGLGGTNAHVVVSEAPAARDGAAVRRPLPAPAFRRRRLWIDRDEPAPRVGGGGERPAPAADDTGLVAALLDLRFGGGDGR